MILILRVQVIYNFGELRDLLAHLVVQILRRRVSYAAALCSAEALTRTGKRLSWPVPAMVDRAELRALEQNRKGRHTCMPPICRSQ